MTKKAEILAILFLVLCLRMVAAGRTIYVDDDSPADFDNIQAAIDDANDGDIVIVAKGTYYQNIAFRGPNITLTSTDPNDPEVVSGTVIQGNGTTSVVTFSGNEDTNCQLTGFTITDGHTNDPQHGGGIQGNGMTAKINNCNIIGNSAYRRGGGLFNCDGQITGCTISGNTVTSPATTEGAGLHSCDGPISNCTISNNSSGSITQSGRGGGLYSCHGPITNCTITGNSAGGNGGGLYECDGPISNCTIVGNIAQHYMFQCRGGGLSDCGGAISNCIISDNVAGESGGGLNRCRGVISDCRISGNTAIDWEGGGLRQCHGSIINCTIIGNSASRSGGGLSWCKSIRNCIIGSNRAGENGGGLYDCTGPINCTISGNRAIGNGGGIYYRGSGTTVTNCILWDNKATKGNEIYLDFSIVCGQGGCLYIPSSMSVRYSNVQGGETAAYIEPECTLNWGVVNIEADPCFASPGYWDPNGTPEDANDDFFVTGDYHLKSQAGRRNSNTQTWVYDEVTSPCIDAGNPHSPIGLEPFPNGGIINMGAYGGTAEASKSYFGKPPCEIIVAGDVNGDCLVNFLDFRLMALHWCEDNNP